MLHFRPMTDLNQRKARMRAHYSNPHYIRSEMNDEALTATADAERSFPFASSTSTACYRPRSEQHYGLLLDAFKDDVQGTILDMGSRDDTFERRLGRSVSRFDKNNPELPVFDWEKEPLPVKDASYDTVVCLDTLEHIERIHVATDDLFRAAKSSVIISLPNCWKQALKGVLRGQWKHAGYGIPLDVPMDRHRWFCNAEEAFDFLVYRAALSGWQPHRIRFHTPAETWWQKLFFPWVFTIIPEHYAKNWFTETLMISFVRKNGVR